jgi:hypothetical protein
MEMVYDVCLKTNQLNLPAPAAKFIQIPAVKKYRGEKAIKEEKDLSKERIADENEKAIAMSNDKERQTGMAVTDSEQKSFLQPSDTQLWLPLLRIYLITTGTIQLQ